MFKQVKFTITDPSIADTDEIFGGIAYYENDELQYIICGCCGGTFEPDEVEIKEVYSNWIDLTETIVGDDIYRTRERPLILC